MKLTLLIAVPLLLLTSGLSVALCQIKCTDDNEYCTGTSSCDNPGKYCNSQGDSSCYCNVTYTKCGCYITVA